MAYFLLLIMFLRNNQQDTPPNLFFPYTRFEHNSTAIAPGGTGTANYLVTIASQVPSTLHLSVQGGLPNGVTQATTVAQSCGAGVPTCSNPFSLNPGSSCCLKLLFTADNMGVGEHKVAPLVATTRGPVYSAFADPLTVTVISAISPTIITVPQTGTIPVNNGEGSLVITNTGGNTAYNVHANLPSFTCTSPTNVTQDSSDCTAIPPGQTCTLKFTSTTPCLAQGGIPIVGYNISSPPTTALAFSIQGYLVFALSSTSSTSPQVIDTSEFTPEVWATNSVPAAISLTDGFSNTASIVSSGGPFSAAKKCFVSTNGQVSSGTWYLPAICQLGGSGQGAGCSNSNADTIDNLFQLGFISGDNLQYWSSSWENVPNARYEFLVSSNGSNQGFFAITNAITGRCSRSINY